MRIVFFLFGIFPIFSFAHPDLGSSPLAVPIFIDGQRVGRAMVDPQASREDFLVDAKSFLEAVASFVNQSVMDSLVERINREVFTLVDFDSVGMSVSFNESRDEIQVEIPLALRRLQKFSLRTSAAPVFGSDPPSGFLNIRSNHSITSGDAASESHLPSKARLDLTQSAMGWTFESSADYLEHRESAWRRGDVLLAHDDEESRWRWSLGDIRTENRFLEQSHPLGGISVRKGFSRSSERIAYRLSETEIILKRDSRVDVMVNNILFTQLLLPAGKFNLLDDPILSGLNRVTLKVRDDLGTIEEFEFDLSFEGLTLERGEQEFSYSMGYPWTDNGADRIYQKDGVFTSLLHRYGWSDTLTLGFNFQNYFYHSTGGGELSKASSLGLFILEVAGCDVLGVRGFAVRGRWRSLDRFVGLDPSWRLSVDLLRQSETFFPVTVGAIPSVNFETAVSAQVSKVFPGRIVATIGEIYEGAFFNLEPRKTEQAILTLPLGTRFRIDASYQRVRWTASEDRGLVSLVWTDEPERYSATAFHDSGPKMNGVSLSRFNEKPTDDWRADFRVQSNTEDSMAALDIDGLFRPVEVRLSQFSTRISGMRSDVTTLGLDTGILWGGSRFAISTPVDGAFVLRTNDSTTQIFRDVPPEASSE